MANAVESYTEAWNGYTKKPGPYVWNGLTLIALTFLLLPFVIGAGLIPVIAEALGMPLSKDAILPIVLASTVIQIGFGLAISILVKSFYGVCDDIMEGRKADWRTLLGHAGRRWRTIAGIAILQLIAVLLVSIPLIVLPMVLIIPALQPPTAILVMLLIFAITIPVIILLAAVFEPAYPIAMVEYVGALAALREGLGLVRRNLKQYLLLVVMTMLVDLANLIPFAQQFLTIPVNSYALLAFYKADRSEHRNRKKG